MNFGDSLRKATRPIVTIIFAAVIAHLTVNQIEVSERIWVLLSGVILWWFADRTREHIKEKTEKSSTKSETLNNTKAQNPNDQNTKL